ncbi:MAG: hypothetical protein M1835_008057 [Candelina submexicana]|nr:MAG: hypothetical protein M1835_008057 [Candelina submexicana]
MGGGPGITSEHMLLVLPVPEPVEIVNRIREKHPQIQITYHEITFKSTFEHNRSDVPPKIYKDVTILVTLSALPPSPDDCPNLKLIHFLSAGTNHVAESPIYKDTDITITTSSGIHGPQISEWVLMTALGHSHRFPRLYEWQQQKKWGRFTDLFAVRDMAGQRLGVLGYGSIGRQVGRVAKAMGMDVIAYTASPRNTDESKKDKGFILPGMGDPDGEFPSAWYSGLEKHSLQHFLKQDIDVLLVSVPLTRKTEHFLGKEEFEILGRNRNAFISNISRGQIMDQAELIQALKKDTDAGGLRGAALDVTDPEPLPEDSPLWTMPNVLITPHISGSASAYMERSFQVLDANLTRLEKGEELLNVVDRKRGY